MLLDGAMNGDCFEAYVDQVLSKATKPGDLVILDNLSSHKTTKAKKAFKRNKIRFLFLPPYSPDLNPIENAFSKLKSLARSNAKRTIEALWDSFDQMLRALGKPEYSN
jgi:transposase